MNYDTAIDRILQEAYFSSPYEKATGIKRQVGEALDPSREAHPHDIGRGTEHEPEPIFNEPDDAELEDNSAFKADQSVKAGAYSYAAEMVAGMVEARIEDGDPVSKKELGEMAFEVLKVYQEYGDEFSLPEIGEYFKLIHKLTGIKPMSTERVRNIERDALKSVRKHPSLDDSRIK